MKEMYKYSTIKYFREPRYTYTTVHAQAIIKTYCTQFSSAPVPLTFSSSWQHALSLYS